MYLLPHEKFEKDCAYILACEEGLVGQAVVARNDADGSFHLGNVFYDSSKIAFLSAVA